MRTVGVVMRFDTAYLEAVLFIKADSGRVRYLHFEADGSEAVALAIHDSLVHEQLRIPFALCVGMNGDGVDPQAAGTRIGDDADVCCRPAVFFQEVKNTFSPGSQITKLPARKALFRKAGLLDG